jgi:hypothetical protein
MLQGIVWGDREVVILNRLPRIMPPGRVPEQVMKKVLQVVQVVQVHMKGKIKF